MDELDQIRLLSEIIGNNVLAALGIWLYATERRRHADTTKAYRRDLRRVAKIDAADDEDEG